jgi:hypothetical protein
VRCGCLRATFKLETGQLNARMEDIGVLLTRVRRDVLPEPLGPINKMDGNVVRPLLRKTTEWRKMGMVRARRIAIARPRGEGFRRACKKSCMATMISGLLAAAVERLRSVECGVAVLCQQGEASEQVQVAC